MSKISKNIRHLRLEKGWSQEVMADKLGISRARIGSYEEERCDPPVETLVKISSLFHLSLDVLVKGDLRKVKPGSLLKVGENRLLFPIVVDKDNNDKIEVITAKASAGYLNGYADPEYFESLPLMNLPFRITGKHRAFPIKGDSMPPLSEGCFVVTRFVESFSDIRNNHTYVLLTKEDGVVYKRVLVNGDSLELHSDNKYYRPYTVSQSDVLEVWEFVCTLNISDKRPEELNTESIMSMLNSMRVELEKR